MGFYRLQRLSSSETESLNKQNKITSHHRLSSQLHNTHDKTYMFGTGSGTNQLSN